MLNHQDKAHFNELSVISPSSYGVCVQHIFLSFVVYILTFVGEPPWWTPSPSLALVLHSTGAHLSRIGWPRMGDGFETDQLGRPRSRSTRRCFNGKSIWFMLILYVFCLNLLKHLNLKIHQPLTFADSAHKALRLERSIPNSYRWLQPKAMPAVVVAHRLLFCIPLPTVGVDPWSCPIGIPRYSKKKMLVSSRSCVTPFSGKAKKAV
jgi:hypothetical protein